MKGEILRLEIEGKDVTGELALELPPGTTAAVRDRALDALLGAPLDERARELDLAIAAAPCRFATPRNGKDERGRTVFDVRGRVEGDRLVPVRKGANT
jgi:hypothetical protein